MYSEVLESQIVDIWYIHWIFHVKDRFISSLGITAKAETIP